jgi:tellurite resistance protein
MTCTRPAAWDQVTLNYFAMPFGLAGLAGAWATAAATLAAPAWAGPLLAVLAALAWLAVAAGYARRLLHEPTAVRAEFADPAASPFAAFAPVTVALLGRSLLPYALLPGQVITAIGIAAALACGAWWTAGRILAGPLRLEQVSSAWLIPLAVCGIETATAASAAGWLALARLCLGAGLLGWAALGGLTLARLLLRPPPAGALQATMAIDAAIAAAAGVGYFSVYGDARPGGLAYAVAGYGLTMGVVQARLLPRYLRMGFAPSSWVFAFVAAVTATDILRWMAAIRARPDWPAWAALATATALIGWITARTLFTLATARRRHVTPEGGLRPWTDQA